MYELALTTETQNLNKKHGYNNTVAVLKEAEFDGFAIILIQHVELKYFKNGRANMHVERKYSVRISSDNTKETSFDRNWIKTKAEANKYFNELKKQFKNA